MPKQKFIGEDVLKAFYDGDLDFYITECNIVYNKEDDRYYIYKGEFYYGHTDDKRSALELFDKATEEIKNGVIK